jgi:hypothetical protein
MLCGENDFRNGHVAPGLFIPPGYRFGTRNYYTLGG